MLRSVILIILFFIHALYHQKKITAGTHIQEHEFHLSESWLYAYQHS